MRNSRNESELPNHGWPIHGWIGLGLVTLFWILNWSLEGHRTHWGFFPLWLGYGLTVDAWVLRRKGHSLLTRNGGSYIALFIISIPAWWLFEFINRRTQNWVYIGGENLSDTQYVILSSLSFSTVMPAVFGTTELVSTFGWFKRFKRGPQLTPTTTTLLGFLLAGCIMMVLLLAWPRYFFFLAWVSIYFILEPTNFWLGNRTIIQHTAAGDWRPIMNLWTGCLICGFFWEMWNFYSSPKWIYQVPYVDFIRIFEMPILGYGGYLPFALELFALFHLSLWLFRRKELGEFLQVSSDEK